MYVLINIYVFSDDSMRYHNNQPFSTFDRDNDKNRNENCAKKNKDGWWYNTCFLDNLNGFYHKGLVEREIEDSVVWTEIKIRPKHFRSTPL